MTPGRYAVLAVLAVAVVGVLTTALRRPDKHVAQVTVLIPRRDLRDSGPVNQGVVARRSERAAKKNRRPRRSAGKGRPVVPSIDGVGRHEQSPTRTGARTAPLPSRKRQTPKAKAPHRKRRPRPVSGGQGPAPSPPPQKQCPPVDVQAPLPVGVTTPLAAINC